MRVLTCVDGGPTELGVPIDRLGYALAETTPGGTFDVIPATVVTARTGGGPGAVVNNLVVLSVGCVWP